MKKPLPIPLLMSALWLAATAPAAEPITLARDGTPTATIVLAEDPTRSAQLAAFELHVTRTGAGRGCGTLFRAWTSGGVAQCLPHVHEGLHVHVLVESRQAVEVELILVEGRRMQSFEDRVLHLLHVLQSARSGG